MEEGQMNNIPPNNNFFAVKRNDIDVMQQEIEDNQEKPEEWFCDLLFDLILIWFIFIKIAYFH